MISFLLRRTFHLVFVVLGVSLVSFLLVHLSGDPVALLASPDATAQDIANLRQRYGFDLPLYEQYGQFLARMVRGDFGNSLRTGHDNLQLVLSRLPATFNLAAASMGLAILIAIPVGIGSALYRNSFLDLVMRSLIILGQSAPGFWIAIMLILIVSLRWRLLPPSGYDSPASLILPAVALSTNSAAELARFMRSAMLDVMAADYVRTAHAKGLQHFVVTTKHVVRNALIPVVTIIGLRFGSLMGGAVVTETVFNWPGMGALTLQAVSGRDIHLVQICLMVITLFVVLSSLFVDLLYSFLDPRIRYG